MAETTAAGTAIEPSQDEHHDAHGHDADPSAAPMRSDVRESFPNLAVGYIAGLGLIAIVAGVVLGLTVVNN